MALLSLSADGGDREVTAKSAMVPLFEKEFEEPDPYPQRTWSMDADEFQIFLSSEIKEESSEPKAKFIFSLNFA